MLMPRGRGKEKGERIKERANSAARFFPLSFPVFCPLCLFVRAACGVVANLCGEVADTVLVEEVA